MGTSIDSMFILLNTAWGCGDGYAPAQSQRPDGILNEIVVNIDSTVVHIARQLGQQRVRVFDRVTHLAVGKDLQIYLFYPRLKESYCRIRYLQALFLAFIRI